MAGGGPAEGSHPNEGFQRVAQDVWGRRLTGADAQLGPRRERGGASGGSPERQLLCHILFTLGWKRTG